MAGGPQNKNTTRESPDNRDVAGILRSEPPKFYRTADGQIFHDRPSIRTRLDQLADNTRLSLNMNMLMIAVPLGIVMLIVFGLLINAALPGWDSYSSMTRNFIVSGWVIGIILAEFLMGLGVRTTVNNIFESRYNQLLNMLVKTDLPLVIADDQFSTRLFEESAAMPLIKWTGSPPPVTFEDRIRFSADYCNALDSFRKQGRFSPGELRHGNCLRWTGSSMAKLFAGMATGATLLCGLGCMFSPPMFACALPAGIPVVFLIANNIRRQAAIRAICDFFNDDYKLEPELPDAPPFNPWEAPVNPDAAQILRSSAGSGSGIDNENSR